MLAQLGEGTEFHGRYRVARLIKAGGIGAVYEVFDSRSDRRRALKILHPSLVADDNIRAKFEAEAKVTGMIESDHLVEIFDAGIDPTSQCPFIVMELLRGEDLDAVVRRGPMPAQLAITLLTQVAGALEKTHAAGIVHRDLKPENLFLSYRDDGTPRVRIMDFGIAKVVSKASSAAASRVIGTPIYMAPEQIQATKRIGLGADLYALGHIAFTFLVGKPYWDAEVQSLDMVPFLMRVSVGTQEPASARAARYGTPLTPAFDSWFTCATALTPEHRFRGAREMIAQLSHVLSLQVTAPSLAPQPSQPVAARSGPLPPGVTPPVLPTVDRAALSQSRPITSTQKSSAAWLGVLGVVGVCFAGTAWFFSRGPTNSPPAGAEVSSPPAVAQASSTASAAAPQVEIAPAATETSAEQATATPPQTASASAAPAKTVTAVAPAQPTQPKTAQPKTGPAPTAPAPPKPKKKGEGLL